jgi:hypothetical protein
MGRVWNSVLLLGMAVFFAAYAWMASSTDTALASRGIQTDATVVSSIWGKGGTQTTLRFTDRDGHPIEATTNEVRGTPAAGTVIRIVYDPADPTGHVRDIRLGDDTWITVVLGLMATGCALYGTLIAVGAVRPPRRRSFP